MEGVLGLGAISKSPSFWWLYEYRLNIVLCIQSRDYSTVVAKKSRLLEEFIENNGSLLSVKQGLSGNAIQEKKARKTA